VFCTIYEFRPTPCREFTVGDDRCTQARAAYGLPPLAVDDQDHPSPPLSSPGESDPRLPRRAA
jgi:Fe-S-cluster containining protein